MYLTAWQRERLDELTRRRGVPLAAIVREALDRYLADAQPQLGETLSAAFGAMPDLEVPSREEWDHGRPAGRH